MKRLTHAILIIGCLSVIPSSCGVQSYESANIKSSTAQHKKIAILPASIASTQPQNKTLSLEEQDHLNKKQSETFQNYFYNRLLKESMAKKHPIAINILDVNRTNQLLNEQGIDYKNIQSKTATELSNILGVDAVVYSHIDKDILLGDNAMKAAKIGNDVVRIIGNTKAGEIQHNANMLSIGKIKVNSTLNDAKTDNVLWKGWKEFDVNSDTLPQDLLDAYGNQCARSFPYRK